jgi:hypothetical protein
MSDSTTSSVLPSVVTPRGAITGRRRGRPASMTVSMRKAITQEVTTEVILGSTEPQTVSQIVRVLESKGCSTPTLWTDVYQFLNFGSHGFFSTGEPGTRQKWTANLPVLPVVSPVSDETLPVDPT